jgi:phosphohistidine swiveling domain-containing protein
MTDKGRETVKLWDAAPGFDFNEEVDVPEMHSYFHDGVHSVPRLTPMYSCFYGRLNPMGSQYACETLSTPKCKGWSQKIKDGSTYVAMHIIRDEAEIQRRTAKFKEALVPWIQDFDGLWGGYKNELLTMYDRLKSLDVDKATNIDLLHHLWDMISTYRRMWEIHFLAMYVSMSAFAILEGVVANFGYTAESPEFQDMFKGFDNKAFQVDRMMWERARAASDAGLADVFRNYKSQDVMAKLEESEAGRKWNKDFIALLQEEGWRMVRMMDFNEPYWLEEPSTAIAVVKTFLLKGADYSLDETRVKMVEERERAINALLEKVPAEEKEWMKALIELGGKAGSYSEEHDLYCELYLHALVRRGLLGIGRRLVQAGTIDRPDDTLFLNPDEIEQVMLAPEFHKLQYIANRRRAQWEEQKFQEAPPVFTERESFDQAVGMDLVPSEDVIIMKLVVGEMPNVKPELKADIYGVCGAPGVAEGPARVIMTYDELKEVMPGEILVCPGTNPAWTPIFGVVKAVVADRGGTLSHTAIVGREYNLPTIVNCFEGTAKIKTGTKIRVDATQGAIYILDK